MNDFYAAKVRRDYPVGAIHGRLTIAGYIKAESAWWLRCKCSCGSEKVVKFPNQMKRGLVSSCGCLANETRAKTARRRKAPLPAGEAAMRFLWRNYRDWATRRRLTFSIGIDDFRVLTSATCHYCGTGALSAVEQNYNGEYRYNGLDQVVPGEGYTLENVVTCCKVCNRAKFKMSYDEFKSWIRRAAAHIGR